MSLSTIANLFSNAMRPSRNLFYPSLGDCFVCCTGLVNRFSRCTELKLAREHLIRINWMHDKSPYKALFPFATSMVAFFEID